MAQQTQDRAGNILTIPGTYVSTTVINNQSSIGVAGVVVLVGEAEEGRAWDEGQDSDPNTFGYSLDQINAAIQEFGSGNLIDAFNGIISANADANIQGSAQRVYLLKTNRGSKASAVMTRSGLSTYASLQARKAGKPGNNISFIHSTSVAEVAPQIQLGYYPLVSGSASLTFRINGGAQDIVSVSAGTLPPAVATAIQDADQLAQGGQDRAILAVSGTIALAVPSASAITLTRSVAWANLPSVGDTLYIPTGSVVAGGADQNVGSYRITAVSSTVISAARVSVTSANVAVAAAAVVAVADAQAFSPITIRNATGMDRGVLASVTGQVTPSALTSSSVKLTLDSGILFAATAQVGELVWVPTTFGTVVLAGWYQVSASTNIVTGSITLARLSNGSLSGSPAAVAASSGLFSVLKSDIDGVGKSMEIVADANAQLAFLAPSTGVAIAASQLLASSLEREVKLDVSKPGSPASITQSFLAGGDIPLSIGYAGTTATMTITDSILTTSTSVLADDLSINLADYPTLQNLVDFINSHPSYSAAIIDQRWRAMSPVDLDNVTAAGIASSISGSRPGRIKRDNADWFIQVSSSTLIEAVAPLNTLAGLPDAALSSQFLAGGAKGATTGANVSDAIDSCELLAANFIVPCFEQDASLDVAAGITDPASDYQIDAINAKARAHCISMSETKSRKNRSAICAKWDTYDNAKAAARTLSHPRLSLCFQRSKDSASNGTIKTFGAWYTAVKTAGMSAAAGYKGIVKKFVGITGIISPAGFDSRRRGDLEDALVAGLVIVESVSTGGFRYVSDQTTYNIDNNFVYNSIQAVYLADLVTLTLIQNSDRAIVGASVADMSAALISSFIAAQMSNFLRLKWTSPSDTAPLGYNGLAVTINGGVASIDVNIFLNGLLYFVPISMSISAVQESA